MAGTLYAVPNLLGAVPPDEVLPARTIAVARTLADWVVETPKAARAFLKSLGMPRPIAELALHELGERPGAAHLDALLAPLRSGRDLGLLSDAGCPGVADPGAALVAAAHRHGLRVVPLVGPSAVLLALMASGLNGQSFAFHGYLPIKPGERAEALRRREAESRAQGRTEIFMETPYRNVALLEAMLATLAPTTLLCVAVDLTLPSESVETRAVRDWRGRDLARHAKRPALFLLQG